MACVLTACGTILARPCQSPGCFRSGAMSCQLLTRRDKQTGRKTNRPWSGLIRLLLKTKTHFRVELPPWVGPQTFVSLSFSPTSRERHLSGPSLPSHVLCKAGPMRDGGPSASAHTAMGWGTHPWGPKICDRDEGGRTQGTPRSTQRVGSRFCWQWGRATAAPAPDLARCQMWGAGSAQSPKGHGSQPGFKKNHPGALRKYRRLAKPGLLALWGVGLGTVPAARPCPRPPRARATALGTRLLWGPGCTGAADGENAASVSQ